MSLLDTALNETASCVSNMKKEDDLKTRIFGAFVVKFLACLPLLEFSNVYKMV